MQDLRPFEYRLTLYMDFQHHRVNICGIWYARERAAVPLRILSDSRIAFIVPLIRFTKPVHSFQD